MDVAVGIIDVKSYYIETPEDVAERVRRCLAPRAGRAARVRARLRPQPDRALGRAAEARATWSPASRIVSGNSASGRDVKPAFRTNDAFLADVAATGPGDGCRLWWLGQSGFLLRTPRRPSCFDPYLSDSLTRKYADTDKPHVRMTERVVGSGAADRHRPDHEQPRPHRPSRRGDARAAARRESAGDAGGGRAPTRLSPWSRLGGRAERLVSIDAGESVTVAGVRLYGVPAAHDTVEHDERGCCRFLGFVAETGTLRVYHSGDTRLHDGLVPAVAALAPDVVLVPINGSRPERRVAGNMDGREAAAFAHAVGARLAIPHHFDLFDFNTEPPDLFEAECRRIGQAFRTLRHGEGLALDRAQLSFENRSRR